MKTIINKVKENKATILKFLCLLLIIALISLVTLGVLFLTGVLQYDDGFVFNAEILDAFKGKWYGFIVFILIQTLLSMLLCVIPGVAAAFVMFSSVLYPNPWMAFLLSYSCVIISSSVLYIVGRMGGYKICEKLLGKEDCEKSLNLLRTRGTVYFPLMMLFPIFPDDALVMIAGVTKMKLGWFIPSIVICRGVGAATIIFGMSVIPFNTFTSSYDWLILLTVCFFWIMEIFQLANKVDVYFERKRNPKENVVITPTHPKSYLKFYRSLITILLSLGISFISFGFISEVYQWLVIITVCFFWVREIFLIADKIHDEIQYFKRAREAALNGNPVSARPGSVSTFHSIATVILCSAIMVLHSVTFDHVLKLVVLVTVSFFWVREVFKLAYKIDRHIDMKRNERIAALNREIEQARTESLIFHKSSSED